MFPSDDTWLIYWGFLWKYHEVLDDDVMIIDDDYGGFTYIWYDVNDFYCLEIWHMFSWFMEGYDKALSTKETEQVDLDEIKRKSWYLYVAYFVIGWWYYIIISWELMMDIYRLLVWMLIDRYCWWCRSYDSFWWLSWSCLRYLVFVIYVMYIF